jgi:glycosyltransferase involved in cell wall biosynthesis
VTDAITGRSIWVVAKGYHPDEGGMQTYAREVAQAYAALGGRVTVFTQSSAGPRHIVLDGAELIDVGARRGIAAPIALAGAMRDMCATAGPPDLVHATTWRTAVLPMLLGLPYIVTVHGREIMYARGIAAIAMHRALGRARRIIAVSAYTAAQLAQRAPTLAGRTVVAWNGVSGPPCGDPSVPNDLPLILTLCRLEPRKNVAAAVEAAATCAREGIAFRHVVCGRGPELETLRTAVRAQDLGDHISVRGFVSQDQASSLYAAADIFLHPHVTIDGGRDFEGFGIAVADAMAARTACVVGHDGGASELVRSGETGLLVDGRNQQAVTGALRRLLLDRASREGMAAAAQAWARDRFDWKRHCRIALGLASPDRR